MRERENKQRGGERGLRPSKMVNIVVGDGKRVGGGGRPGRASGL